MRHKTVPFFFQKKNFFESNSKHKNNRKRWIINVVLLYVLRDTFFDYWVIVPLNHPKEYSTIFFIGIKKNHLLCLIKETFIFGQLWLVFKPPKTKHVHLSKEAISPKLFVFKAFILFSMLLVQRSNMKILQVTGQKSESSGLIRTTKLKTLTPGWTRRYKAVPLFLNGSGTQKKIVTQIRFLGKKTLAIAACSPWWNDQTLKRFQVRRENQVV